MRPTNSRGPIRLTTVLALGSVAFAGACVQPAPTPAPEPVPERIVSVEPRPQQPSFDRSKPPTLGSLRELTLPPVITRELPNGLKLVIVEHHEIPVADFVLLVGTGAEADPGAHGRHRQRGDRQADR